MKSKSLRKKPEGPFSLYVISQGDSAYVGITNNFTRRLRQHNQEIKGGARYTKRGDKGGWSPVIIMTGFQTHRAVLQCELAMKRRKVPVSFKVGRHATGTSTKRGTAKAYTRGPHGKIRQLEYLLSLGRLNNEAHSPFARNGIAVQVHWPMERYLAIVNMTEDQFWLLRREQGVDFQFV